MSNISDFFQQFFDWLRSLFGTPSPPPEDTSSITPIHRKISLIILNPILPSEGGGRMSQVLGWNDPDTLVTSLIADLHAASNGYVNYEVAERVVVDDFPPLEDGFVYTGAEFMSCWRTGSGFHQPGEVDYNRLVADHHLTEKINQQDIDEVWVCGFPYAGFYESRMAGPAAFWCNAPPLGGVPVSRRFIIMGFSFERGVGEMLESIGHRAESIMTYVYRNKSGSQNLWQLFSRYDQVFPGLAEAGNVHFAPNSRSDYDWGNITNILGHSHAWLNFPDLSAERRLENCSLWGGGDIRAHHIWWMHLFPQTTGQSNGISHNWWKYIVDPGQAN